MLRPIEHIHPTTESSTACSVLSITLDAGRYQRAKLVQNQHETFVTTYHFLHGGNYSLAD
jgi:hypothetical protein